MSGKISNKQFQSGIVTKEAEELILEINDLVRIRTALSFGTKLSQQTSAESAISRKINAKVLELSKIVLKEYNE